MFQEKGKQTVMKSGRTLAVDCLLAIDELCGDADIDRVSTGDIARLIGISFAVVSSILGKLASDELADHIPYSGTKLTDAGRKRASRVKSRCELIELFLNRTLAISREMAAEEAIRLEAAVSEKLIERINEFVTRPRTARNRNQNLRNDGAAPSSDT